MSHTLQKILFFTNGIIIFGLLQSIGVLADEQKLITNNLFVYLLIFGISFLPIYFRKYLFFLIYIIMIMIISIGLFYYDYVLMIDRGFVAFGMIIPSILLIGSIISLIVMRRLYISDNRSE